MLKKHKGLRIAPVSSLQNSWENVVSCKHFFPGNRAGLDVKNGVQLHPQTGYAFETDSARGCFRSTCLDATVAPTAIDGAWTSMSSTQSMLILHAGYINSELSVAASAPDYCRDMRFAIGDLNGAVESPPSNLGFGMSDGKTYRASPLVDSDLQAHVVAVSKYDGIVGQTTIASKDNTFTADVPPNSQVSLGDRIHTAIGTDVPFFRYALARKDNHQLQSGAYRTDTGAVIFANDLQYGNYDGATYTDADVQYPAYFRMHGHWVTGAAIFVFDTIPSADNLMLGIQSMAKAWSDGDYIIWPYWS